MSLSFRNYDPMPPLQYYRTIFLSNSSWIFSFSPLLIYFPSLLNYFSLFFIMYYMYVHIIVLILQIISVLSYFSISSLLTPSFFLSLLQYHPFSPCSQVFPLFFANSFFLSFFLSFTLKLPALFFFSSLSNSSFFLTLVFLLLCIKSFSLYTTYKDSYT